MNDPPDTMLNGAATVTLPEMLAALVFCTVNVRSAVVPVVMVPKLVAVVGVTLKSPCATALGAAEPAVSLPDASTAVTRTKYVVPAVKPVITFVIVCPDVGVVVG